MIQTTPRTNTAQLAHKRLGDGFYEQKLISDQITQLTGRRFTGQYSSSEDQTIALMDSGINVAKQFDFSTDPSTGLGTGIALSKEQAAALTIISLDLVLFFDTIRAMNATHRKTLTAVFAEPVSASLEWRRIEALLVAVGCRVIEGNGSRVRFEKDGHVAAFHRPHPAKEAKPYQVRDARHYLETLGVKP